MGSGLQRAFKATQQTRKRETKRVFVAASDLRYNPHTKVYTFGSASDFGGVSEYKVGTPVCLDCGAAGTITELKQDKKNKTCDIWILVTGVHYPGEKPGDKPDRWIVPANIVG